MHRAPTRPVPVLTVLRRLRDGVDPATQEPLAEDHLCQRADVLRALFHAVAALEGGASGEGAAVPVSGGPPGAQGPAWPPDPAPPRDAAPLHVAPQPPRPARPRAPNSGQPWTEADDARLAEAFDGGATERELAADLGRSRSSIRARLIRLGRGALLEDGPAPRYPVAVPIGAGADPVAVGAVPTDDGAPGARDPSAAAVDDRTPTRDLSAEVASALRAARRTRDGVAAV